MKYKSTLLLLVAVVIAGLTAYSLSKKPTSAEAARQRRRLLPDFQAGEVRRLAIQGPDGRIVCRREGADEWRILEPVNVRADRWRIEGILDQLETAEKVSSTFPRSGRDLDMAQYGLDEPARTVTVSLDESGAPAWTLKIGKPAGAAESVFVALDGQEGVFAVNKDVTDRAAVTVMDLRSRALAPRISAFDLETVALSATGTDERPPVELECAKAAKRWELTRPVRDLADRGEIEALANRLYDHHIADDDFIVDDPTKAAEYGLDEPALTVTLSGKGKSHTVTFARRQEGDGAAFYALTRGEPTIVKVPESLFEGLRKGPDDLRERTLADFRVDDVEEAAVAGPTGELLLTRRDGAWQMDGEPPTPADADAVDGLLKELEGLEVRDFAADEPADLAPYGLTEGEAVSVTLRDADGDELASLSLGRADEQGDAVYARRAAYPAVLAVPKGDYHGQVRRGRVAFLDRRVLDEPRAEARQIVLERGREHFECAWRREQAAWELTEPATGAADRYAVQALLGDLAPLRALAFAAEQADDLSAYGLAEPAIVLQVTYQAEPVAGAGAGEPPPPRVRTLHVGGAAEEPAPGRFARLADEGRVFVLPEAVVEHLRANLASREVCRAADLTGLTFRVGGRSVAFAYDDEELAWTDAEGNPLDDAVRAAVAGAAALLSDFRAARVADYVEKSPALYGFDEPFLVITLDEEATKGKQVVVGAEAPGGGRYVKGPATGFVHVIADADAATLAAALAHPNAGTEAPAPGQ